MSIPCSALYCNVLYCTAMWCIGDTTSYLICMFALHVHPNMQFCICVCANMCGACQCMSVYVFQL